MKNLNGAFLSGRSAKQFAAAGLVVSLFACASVNDPSASGISAVTAYHNDARASYDFEARANAMLETLGHPAADGVSLVQAAVIRAEIAQQAMPSAALHEASFAAEDSRKLDNFTTAAAEDTPSIIQTQGASQGGWSLIGEEYVHAHSGMTCPKMLGVMMMGANGEGAKTPTALTQIQVYDAVGNDTSCNYASPDQSVYVTFYVSNWPDITLDQHFGSSLKLIVDRFSVQSAAQVIVAQAEATGRSSIEGDTKAAAFLLEPADGVTFKTALWVNKTGDWHVKERATFAVAVGDEELQFSSIELLSAILHAMKLSEIDDHINKANTVDVRY